MIKTFQNIIGSSDIIEMRCLCRARTRPTASGTLLPTEWLLSAGCETPELLHSTTENSLIL